MKPSIHLITSLATVFLVGCIGQFDDGDEAGSSTEGVGAGGPFGSGTSTDTSVDTANGTSNGTGVGTGTGVGDCPEGDPIACGIVNAHNAVRANVSPAASPPMAPLVWSPEAAAVATDWANNCQFGHNPGLSSLGLGENIYAAWGKSSTPEEVVNSWASEVADYNYGSNSCSGVCGHYTQIVWRDTVGVGCAVSNCPDGMEMWVCDYTPPGNYIGQKPY